MAVHPRLKLLFLQVGFGAALLAAWELASGPLINPLFFSRPSLIVDRLATLISSGDVWPHVQATWTAFVLGFPVGAVAGIAMGILLGLLPRFAPVIQPYILALYSIPKIALAPLFIIVFGIGVESKVAIVAMSVFFFVFLNSFMGVRSINLELVNLARVMGASRGKIAWRILFPSALPAIVVGLRGSVPYGIIGAIVGEYIVAARGLGWLIQHGANSFNAAGMFAAVGVLVITTMTVLKVLAWVEGRLIRWRPVAETSVSA